jgi:tetratricopeptide (TPR) repeat protein
VSRFHSFAASAALGAALGAIAFGAGAGTHLGRAATTEIAILLVAGVIVAVALLHPRAGPWYGGPALFLFGVLAAVTALSMSWSIAPDSSLEEAARALAYLAAFAAALMAGRILPRATPAVLYAVLIAAVAVAGWALLTRIFPGDLGSDVLGARLAEPFGYWNALGSMAALGIPAALWLGARRDAGTAMSALAYPALGVLALTILLTQSRGALGAAAIAVAIWLAAVPLRLRTIPVLALPAAAVAPVAAWALSKDAFTEVLQPLSAREAVAGDFGLMVLALLVGLFAAGLAVRAASTWRPPSLHMRRRAGAALVAAACLLVLGGVASVAVSDRGLGGTVSDRFNEITDDRVATPGGAARLGSVSSSRGGYWRQAFDVFEERPAIGRGAGAFGLASLRYRELGVGSVHAHGFLAQTMADLGLVGVAAALALLAAWLAAAARAIGLVPRGRPRPEWTGERVAVTALALCALVFGLHSLIDWTWFVPGPSVAAVVAAGFVAGRGPLGDAAVRTPRTALSAGRLLGVAAVLVTAGLCAWAVWLPERAARTNDRALALLDDGKIAAASREADRARDIDPYSAEPLFTRAEVLNRAGRQTDAYRVLEKAVLEHPRDPETWLRLGRFELDELDLPDRTIETTLGAFAVDPYSRQAALLRDRAIEAGGSNPGQ